MYVPPGLVVLLVLCIVGFLISMTGALRDKTRASPYQQLANSPNGDGGASPAGVSYQQDYRSRKQKVVKYTVIDGRLVDS
jgi:hypothetical protein